MPLFDQYESYESVENEDKSRLFDTLNEEGRSVHDYLKVLVPVVLAVLVIGGGVVFFTMPGMGDEVRVPQGLDDAVKTYYLDNEKRVVTEATYYYCKDFYSARVTLEKRPDVTARQLDHGSRRVVATETSDGLWKVISTPVNPNETAEPCSR